MRFCWYSQTSRIFKEVRHDKRHIPSWTSEANISQLCDRRRSQTSCSWRRSQKTTYGRSSPAVRPQERVSSKDWYGHRHYILPHNSTNTPTGMAQQQREAPTRQQVRHRRPDASFAVYDCMRAHFCIYPVFCLMSAPTQYDLLITATPCGCISSLARAYGAG